ncbi:16S rRNA (cytidine(1402)-2'-O)-methyltransferase [Pseudogracilibacillus auburnensis]|uniref:16S rRNA (cytidine(1402)-2'-O)-methyltransferase n=1 Tax=Pseudogracilibacillus auburnensis TaxID=1494959 RepID=UPI001A9567BD|nr:16S rRNA (cytidine(1402)-2'-O)-methyltransferase [Pseudogracilibacillus auburnensis]MBO1004470.1 16S rRNA (cytidine(1402)-2'-O)-methyltransferase [Pseudogracilibacillus auburnensis]
MQIQKSYENKGQGTLYVVPTPIGNLEDITFRAIHTLKKVDLIAAEDTRHTKKLLTHFEIKNQLVSYHEHNKIERANQIMERLLNGKEIAIVSDAGMPAISDPGFDLVREAIDREINVVVLPGANAALCALVGSGLSTSEFLFHGFLPRKKQEKEAELTRLKGLTATLIFYESPYRLKDTLRMISKRLGNRQIVIAREITKIYEQIIRGNVEEVLDWMEKDVVKGECCIIVEGNKEEEETDILWWASLTIPEHVLHYEQQDRLSHKEAMKQVAIDRSMTKRDIYRQIHVKK